MRCGFCLPTRGPTASREGILALARGGERLGLPSAMVADHSSFRTKANPSRHTHWMAGTRVWTMRWRCSPFSGGGRCDRAAGARRLRVGGAVPQSGADGENGGSLDVLSSGRPTLGVGFSRLRKEFASLNGPAFNARGAVIEEWIAIFKQRLWSLRPSASVSAFCR